MSSLNLKVLSIAHADKSSVLFQAAQVKVNSPLLFKLADNDQLCILQQNLNKVVKVRLEKIVDKHIPLVTLTQFERFVVNTCSAIDDRKRPYRPRLES